MGIVHVPLTQGKVAIIDAEDWALISQFKWYAKWSESCQKFYAATNVRAPDGGRATLRMHRLILEASDGNDVDHVDLDTLNNRRSNLRECSRSKNKQNGRRYRTNQSGYKGVCWKKRSQKWVGQIMWGGKPQHIGYFTDQIAAAHAYDACALVLFGDFARTNFPVKDVDLNCIPAGWLGHVQYSHEHTNSDCDRGFNRASDARTHPISSV